MISKLCQQSSLGGAYGDKERSRRLCAPRRAGASSFARRRGDANDKSRAAGRRPSNLYTCVRSGVVGDDIAIGGGVGRHRRGDGRARFKPPIDVATQTPPPATISRLRRLHVAAVRLAKEAPEILAKEEAARSLQHELAQTLIACLRPAHEEEDAVAKRRHALVMRRFHTLWKRAEIVPSTSPNCARRLASRTGPCKSAAASIWGWVRKNICGCDGCSACIARFR